MTERRTPLGRSAVLLMLGLLASAAFSGPAPAQTTPAAPQEIAIGYLAQEEPPREPLSFLDPVLTDEGVQGARLGVADNATTGRFLGQKFTLHETVVPEDGDPVAAARALLADGVRLIVIDLPAETLLRVADLPEARGALVFNARARDDELRREQCRANVLHIMPSRAMLTDALGQYLIARKWTRWFLVTGPAAGDKAYAESVRRTAKRYNARIVEDKPWTFEVGHRRTDSGAASAQDETLSFTQVSDYDILIVADETDQFGEYLSHRTARPRPLAGTQELVATAWSRVHEQWGGTQLQERFQRQTGRSMTERDHTVWLAVRSIGEAATRTNSADPKTLETYIRGPDFALGGFKGRPLSFRDWDGQMRQPVLIAGPRMLVSVSPQEGFLHQFSELDSLGDDRPETRCRLTTAR
jgi:ABC transporter substrate binding protein (PQQ-dependent alcohol dehydrogenase system)